MYSNPGIELAAEIVAARAEMPFERYLSAAVLEPLGLGAVLRGSPAADLPGSLDDLMRFAAELLAPGLVATETLVEATTVQFPGLAGVLPDLGRFDPMDWGLGFEAQGRQATALVGLANVAERFGHFGGSGTFLWVDPDVGLALCCLTDREFDPGHWRPGRSCRTR